MFDVDPVHGRTHSEEMGALFVEMDVSSEVSLAAAVKSVVDQFGRIDILVNCAAIQIMGTLLATSSEL